ncbi:MAG: cupin domain-containing protein [Desertimonas sp.]
MSAQPDRAHDLATTPLHLGPGGSARPITGFSWEHVDEYASSTGADGADGRLVMSFHAVGPWTSWERHPIGDEVVIATSGTHRFVQELPDREHEIVLRPGEALINPAGVWHTAESEGDGGWILTITPGQGTEHRPR